jgi:uncharacterized membrane protein
MAVVANTQDDWDHTIKVSVCCFIGLTSAFPLLVTAVAVCTLLLAFCGAINKTNQILPTRNSLLRTITHNVLLVLRSIHMPMLNELAKHR